MLKFRSSCEHVSFTGCLESHIKSYYTQRQVVDYEDILWNKDTVNIVQNERGNFAVLQITCPLSLACLKLTIRVLKHAGRQYLWIVRICCYIQLFYQ